MKGRKAGETVRKGGKSGRSGTVIAIDLGATKLRIALVSGTGSITRVRVEDMPPHPPGASAITGLITRSVRALATREEIASCAGIGIGAAGPVDAAHTMIVRPPNIPLETVPLAGPLEEAFGLPVRLVNDCCAGLLGEAYFGEGRGCRNFVYLTISTGIGAGIIANGSVVTGRDGNAGEVGHLFVDSDYDLTCGCGGTGHWEGYASGRFLPRFYRAWRRMNGMPEDPEAVSAVDVFRGVRESPDPAGHGFVRELGRINGRGISDIIVAYDPEAIVLDGSVVLHNPDLILPRIGEFADRFLPMPRLVVSSLLGSAPLLGASVIARGYDTRFGSVE